MKYIKRKLFFILLVTLFAIYISVPEKLPISINLPHVSFNKEFQKTFLNKPLLLGLDLVGGARLTFEADTSQLDASRKQEALSSLQNVIERRVNLFGVSESNVLLSQFEGKDRVIVELPGVSDTKQAIAVVGQTAQLSFAEVSSDGKDLKKTDLTGADLKSAQLAFDSVGGKPMVSLTFTDEGAKKFAALTEKNVGKVIPIVLDDQVVSAPVVNEKIADGNAQISGNFTQDQATQLAVQLNAGALPIPVKLIEERTIGATLGNAAIAQSVKAGVLGVTLVFIFMLIIYGKLGLIADIALVIFAVISLSLYKLIPIVVTLPGITGFLLSVGMAVDANILIFERYREEKAKQLSTAHALEVAFGRAWNSIRDANVATLVTAFVLANPLDWPFLNTSGPVRGFAYTLALGILISLFTSLFVSRNLLRFFIVEKSVDANPKKTKFFAFMQK